MRGLKVAYVVLAISACMFAWQAVADRSPPYKVLSVEPAVARPGDIVRITARVWRDMSRKCNAEFSRYMYDRDGMRFDLGHSTASWELIAGLEREYPGVLKVAVQVPLTMLPGRARVQTSLAYACNPAQALWPIEVTSDLPFTVLPPL